jgi:uncharacterized protein YdcH (DUF465 family)
MSESKAGSIHPDLLSYMLERERATNLYLLAKLDAHEASSFGSASENSELNEQLIHLKQQSTDFANLDSFITQHDLLLPKNRTKFLALLDDGICGIPALRSNLVRSQVSEGALANAGALFLYFDDVHIQNHQLQQEAAELEFEIAQHRARESARSDVSDDFSADGDCRGGSDDLREELRALNSAGRQLLAEKEALESEIQRLKSTQEQGVPPPVQQELDELQRESVRLKAKCSVLSLENRRLGARLAAGRRAIPK